MNRFFAATLSGATLLLGNGADADVPTTFNDDACPQANASGRLLNSLNASGKATNDQMFSAAGGLVDAYNDCARAFDQLVRMKNNDGQSSDYIIVHRAYARLQVARSLQRVGSLHQQIQEPDKARAAYDAAMRPLDELEAVIGASDPTSSGSEGKLLNEGRALRTEIKAAEAALPPATAASAVPAPSASP